MAGLRRSKRLESCSQPDQDKVTKIAKTSKNQEKVVPEKNKKTGGSAMVEPSDPGVDGVSSHFTAVYIRFRTDVFKVIAG
jgi:hypothetical protein